MRHHELTTEQEIKDHDLRGVLGALGRGVLSVAELPELLEFSTDSEETARATIFNFIGPLDRIDSNEHVLVEALTAETPSTKQTLKSLEKCSIKDAVNALVDCGTIAQRAYLFERLEEYAGFVKSGIPIVEKKWQNGAYVTETTGHEPINAKCICTGLWRDIVYASMIGTPELGALTIARNHMRHLAQEKDEKAEAIRANMNNLPRIRSYHSYIFPPRMEEDVKYNKDNKPIELIPRSIDGVIGYAFPELAKTYEQILKKVKWKRPDLDESKLEHKAVQELAQLVEKSAEYNSPNRNEGSPYRSHFAEQLAWAQLGEQTQRQLRGMRRKIKGVDLHNIGRFIGKSGDNPYELEWRRIERFADSVSPDNTSPAREYFLLLAHKAIAKQCKALGNEAAASVTSANASIDAINQMSDDEILTRFSKERSRLEQKRNSHMSLAQKALTLHFIYKSEDGKDSIDWINDAPFGLINRIHTMNIRGVSEETTSSYALAEYMFPGKVTHKLINACHGITKETFDKTRELNRRLSETNHPIGPEDIVTLSKISDSPFAQDVFNLLTQDYSAEQIKQYPWLCRLNTSRTIDFPASGSESKKQKWLAEHSYAYLDGGWNKNSVGKIIATRLELGIEHSVHDASQWLKTFQIPEKGYDIQALKELIKDGEVSDISQIEKICFHSISTENMLIAGILGAPQELRDKLSLPSKTQKIQQMFFAPENQLIYTTLLDLYTDPDLSIDMLREAALSRADIFFEQWFMNADDKNTAYRISKDDLRDRLNNAFSAIDKLDFPEDHSIRNTIFWLSKYGNNRKRYIDDTTSWLTRHTTTPNARLTKVWNDRAIALTEGIGDSARDIEIWQANNALRKYLQELERTSTMPSNLTAEEIVTNYKTWTYELSRVYGSERIVSAISMFKSIYNPKALLPPATIDLATGDGVYKAEILAKDDPRGATIGIDTGCCMTLDGTSADCITSGYRDSNSGFFTLYTPQGRLAAQSYFYVNPEQPNTLVLDNIEANQGRDTNKIVKLYKEALMKYLAERFTSDSEWKIRTVHVGTGYGDAVKSAVLRLPQASTVPNTPEIYTDASTQRQLLNLSDTQIEEFTRETIQNRQTEKVRPQHSPEITMHDISTDKKYLIIVRKLEEQIYPKHIRQYDNSNILTEELRKQGMDRFSFLATAKADSSEDFLGYCIAYLEQSETELARTEPILYVADVAILPEAQGSRIGSKMFEELLKRVHTDGIDKIELHARETTSYAALMQSSRIQSLLNSLGYRLIDHGVIDEFDDGHGDTDKIYLVSIERALLY